MSTGGLLTVTPTDVAVVLLPAASRAIAVSVCVVLVAVRVSHGTEYGAEVSSLPRLAPSRRNCTPATPTLSAALAVTLMLPSTVEPAAGAVIETVGAVVSLVDVALASLEDGDGLAAPSSATTR